MSRINRIMQPFALALVVVAGGACHSGYYSEYYPYDYPWNYTAYGAYTVVHRPLHVVDGWTSRAFGDRRYRGYAVRRHNSPVIVYNATKDDRAYEVNITPLGGDSVGVEIRARQGDDNWDKKRAKVLLGNILSEYDSK